MTAPPDTYPNRMTPLPDAADAAVTKAFAEIPALLERRRELRAVGST